MSDQGIVLPGPLLLVGCGKRGGALLRGWLKRGVAGKDVFVVDPAPRDLDDVQARGVTIVTAEHSNVLTLQRDAVRIDDTKPYVYQVVGGQKRWIVDIPTFTGLGYKWTDVRTVPCNLLQAMPDISLPEELPYNKAVYHLYVIRTKERDALQRDLTQAGIGTGVHYPIPLHLQKAYAWLGYAPGDFPVAERVAAEILSLPIYPQLTYEQRAAADLGMAA